MVISEDGGEASLSGLADELEGHFTSSSVHMNDVECFGIQESAERRGDLAVPQTHVLLEIDTVIPTQRKTPHPQSPPGRVEQGVTEAHNSAGHTQATETFEQSADEPLASALIGVEARHDVDGSHGFLAAWSSRRRGHSSAHLR
jgi:hypothetical protein